ncbi:MAG: efflux RND transporter periplasmic adaptor subunit [Pirellulaceae bacterium]|nr:efflux RND transporter periplasmic adaptor subunit [Pirellulaceae bacterium]
MNSSKLLIVALFVVGAFVGGWYFGTRQKAPSTDLSSSERSESPNPQVAVPKVVAQGRLLPRGGIVNVITPPGQRVARLLVQENDEVIAGETELATLAILDTITAQAELASAQAEATEKELEQKLLTAETNLKLAKANTLGAELKLKQAETVVDLLVPRRQLEQAQEQLNRLQQLSQDPLTGTFVSRSQIEEKELAIARANADLRSASEQQELAIAAAKLGLDSARQAEDAAAQAVVMLKELRSSTNTVALSRQLADNQVASTRVVAPVSGVVLKVFIKPGEAATTTPLLQIGDLSHFECIAEIVDQFAPRVAEGQRVKLTHAALPRPLGGTVRSVSRLVGNSTIPNPNPLAMVDRRTVDVRIELDDADQALAQKLVNLQVTVDIDISSSSTSATENPAAFYPQ